MKVLGEGRMKESITRKRQAPSIATVGSTCDLNLKIPGETKGLCAQQQNLDHSYNDKDLEGRHLWDQNNSYQLINNKTLTAFETIEILRAHRIHNLQTSGWQMEV